MKLLVDIGNSRTKWALASDERSSFVSFGTAPAESEVRLAEDVRAAAGGSRITAVAISSVARRDRLDAVRTALHALALPEPCILKPELARNGLRNGYRDPSRLGVDRWVAMVGAWSLGRSPCVVVDAGTALTIDVIAGNGAHLGGYIVPGIRLQLGALAGGTANVQAGPGGISGGPFGRTTQDAVAMGVRKALASLVDRALVELQASVDDTCGVFVTGGDGQDIAAHMVAPFVLDEHLVFKGMLVCLEPNAY